MGKGFIIALGLDDFVAEFALKEVKADHVAFLVTDATVSKIPDLVQKTNITSHKIFFIKDIFSTSETIQEFLNAFRWLKDHQIDEVYIDATNSITVVEMATYVSASLIDLYKDILGETVVFKLVYVHNEYKLREDGTFGEIRGSEKLVELEKPMDSLNFVLAFDAVRAFNDGRYQQAHETFSLLHKHTSGEKCHFYRGLQLVSEGYNHWDKMNFSQAFSSLQEALVALNKARRYGAGKLIIDAVEKNLEALEKLEEGDASHIILDLFANAARREKEGRYDDAVARSYACIERITQFQLNNYGVDTSHPDYTQIPEDILNSFSQQLGGLPQELELKKNALLLELLDDPIGNVVKEVKYSTFLGLIGMRNSSILAHGTKPIGEANFISFKEKLLVPFFDKFREIKQVDKGAVEMHAHVNVQNIHELLYQESVSVVRDSL